MRLRLMLLRGPLLGLLTLLNGCSSVPLIGGWFEGSSEEPPAELTEFVPEIQVRTLWKVQVGDGVDKQRVNLLPFLDYGRLYVADREGLVEAFDIETGQLVWKTEQNKALSAGPGVGEGLVLLGTSDAEILALSEESGELQWTTRVSSEVLSVPRVARGIVVVQTIDDKVTGLDAENGETLWVYQRAVPTLTLRGSSSPAISSGAAFCGFASGKLVALELETGRPVWETTVTSPSGRSELERMVDVDTDPVIEGGVIYVGTFQGDLAAVSEMTGVVLWRRELSVYAGVSADWRRVYATDSSDQVWAMDAESAAAIWKQDLFRGRRLTAPGIVEDYLAVGDFEGYVHWLAQDDGRVVARSQVGGEPITLKPQVLDGVLYVYSDNGELAALQPVARDTGN